MNDNLKHTHANNLEQSKRTVYFTFQQTMVSILKGTFFYVQVPTGAMENLSYSTIICK